MMKEDRFVGLIFQLDTNRINARGNLAAVNQLEQWAAEGVIHLSMSDTAHEEAEAGRDPRRTAKSSEHWTANTFASDADESRLREIERTLSPQGARTQSDRNDARIVFNAGKYGHVLVTNDRQILRRAEVLGAMGIAVMSDDEAVAMVRNRIALRERQP